MSKPDAGPINNNYQDWAHLNKTSWVNCLLEKPEWSISNGEKMSKMRNTSFVQEWSVTQYSVQSNGSFTTLGENIIRILITCDVVKLSFEWYNKRSEGSSLFPYIWFMRQMKNGYTVIWFLRFTFPLITAFLDPSTICELTCFQNNVHFVEQTHD